MCGEVTISPAGGRPSSRAEMRAGGEGGVLPGAQAGGQGGVC